MTTNDDGCKRKTLGGEEEDVVVCFLFNSSHSHNCAALFNLKLTINGDLIVPENDTLKKLADFFHQDENKERMIFYASCAPYIVGSSSCKYLLIPNEFDRALQRPAIDYNSNSQTTVVPYVREKPCVYTFENNEAYSYPSMLEKPPIALKVDPMAVTVDNKVYVLSRRNESQMVLPEPTFEAYDPEKNSWETLPSPWFNLNTPPFIPSPESNEYWTSPGYAVFGNFIIVSSLNLRDRTKFLIHSYNTLSQEWNPVLYPTTLPVVVYRDDGSFVDDKFVDDKNTNNSDDDDSDDDDGYRVSDYLVWFGEAVVVKNFIYAYVSVFQTLVSYKCCANNNNDTLSFDGSIAMERYYRPECWTPMTSNYYEVSGAVCKIRDEFICLVKTISFNSLSGSKRQPVHLMIFRLDDEKGGISSIIQSFDLIMPGDEFFIVANISSFSVLPPEVTSNWVDDERNPKRHELSYELGADPSLLSDVGMNETTAIA